VFCHMDDEPNSINLQICSRCTAIITRLNQDQLQRGYEKAMKLGFADKVTILKSLLEGNSEPRNGHIAKRFNRKRPLRASRNDKGAGRRFTKSKGFAFHQGERKEQAVLRG